MLPQRETSAPELELSGLTFEKQLKEPETEPELTAEAGSPDPAPSRSGLSEETEPRTEGRDEETVQDEEFSLE